MKQLELESKNYNLVTIQFDQTLHIQQRDHSISIDPKQMPELISFLQDCIKPLYEQPKMRHNPDFDLP